MSARPMVGLWVAVVAVAVVGSTVACGGVRRATSGPAAPSPSLVPAATPQSLLLTWSQNAAAPKLDAPASVASSKRYWHWRLQTGGAPGMINERWVGISATDPTFFSVGGQVHQADPADWAAHRFMIEGRAFTFTELRQWPTDDAGMSAFLAEPYHTTAFTPRIFGEAIELSMAPTAPASLAAAYRVISQRPEVHYAGQVRDPLGRPGLALVFEFDHVQNQLIVDPHTGAALDNRAVSMADGSLQLLTVVEATGWMDSPPAA